MSDSNSMSSNAAVMSHNQTSNKMSAQVHGLKEKMSSLIAPKIQLHEFFADKNASKKYELFPCKLHVNVSF
jgi:hypothetical protein